MEKEDHLEVTVVVLISLVLINQEIQTQKKRRRVRDQLSPEDQRGKPQNLQIQDSLEETSLEIPHLKLRPTLQRNSIDQLGLPLKNHQKEAQVLALEAITLQKNQQLKSDNHN
jgi:hypothetical protein